MSDTRNGASGVGAEGRWTAAWAEPVPVEPEPELEPGPETDPEREPEREREPEPEPARDGVLLRRVEAVPLRGRLVAILVVLLVGALGVSGAIAVAQLDGILVAETDDSLRGAADPVFRAVISGQQNLGRGPFPSDFVAYVDWTNGRADDLIAPATPGSETATDLPTIPVNAESLQINQPFTVGSRSGSTTWRVLARTIYANGTTTPLGTFYIATPLTGVSSTTHSLGLRLIAVALVVAASGAVIGWFAVRRSFRPLVEVEETAAAIAAGDLSRRVPERPASTEVGRLTRSLNGMLTRIESAFRAQEASEARTRRFAADASHELRTPLVSIRGFAELYRQGAVPPDEVPRTMRRIEDEAKRMGSLVEDLLLLARLDEQRPGRKDPVDLAVLAADAAHDARGLDPDRRVVLAGLSTAGPSATVVTGDEDRLRQVVANLVANAVRHTPAGTPIEVAVGTETGAEGPRAVLEVRDHGQGLAPDQAARVFERFYRVDSSRRRDTGGGSGLGLSIVAAVVAAHGGSVDVVETPGGGATFRVGLPPAGHFSPQSNRPITASSASGHVNRL